MWILSRYPRPPAVAPLLITLSPQSVSALSDCVPSRLCLPRRVTVSAREPVLRCKQIQIPRLAWSGTRVRVALHKLRASSCILLLGCKRKRIHWFVNSWPGIAVCCVHPLCQPSVNSHWLHFWSVWRAGVARPTRPCVHLKIHKRSSDITRCSSCIQYDNHPPNSTAN